MEHQEQARETVETIRRIEAWGRDEGLILPNTFAVDLGEAYRSARILVETVDSGILLRASRRDAAAAWRGAPLRSGVCRTSLATS